MSKKPRKPKPQLPNDLVDELLVIIARAKKRIRKWHNLAVRELQSLLKGDGPGRKGATQGAS